jgi:hypothetical protein
MQQLLRSVVHRGARKALDVMDPLVVNRDVIQNVALALKRPS